MKIQALHSNFILPKRSTQHAGAYDVFMPTAGVADGESRFFGLGFAARVPEGHVALLLPRSGVGAKFGLELNNTCGVIDSDYTKEWMAAIRTKNGEPYSWSAGDRVVQFLIVPALFVEMQQVDSLEETDRLGGFGSTGL